MESGAVRGGIILGALLFLTPLGAHAESSNLGAYIRPAGGLQPGDKVPDFKAKAITGEEIDLEKLISGNTKIVLAFWSVFCQACLEKLHSMIAIQKEYDGAGVQVISINTDGEYHKGEQSIRDFISAFESEEGVKVNYPILYDESNWLAHAMSVDFLPTIVTVDGSGRVRDVYRRFGERSQDEILEGIKEVVEKLVQDKSSSQGSSADQPNHGSMSP